MWPKAFAQFVELAPHISRLLPMADRFLQSKTATEDVGRRTMEAASAGLQAELGRIAAAQGGIAKQISAVSDGVAALGGEARAVKTVLGSLESRLGGAEARAAGAETRAAGVEAHFTTLEDRLGVIDAHLQRVGERVRLGPVVLLLVLSNLILLAALVALLVRGR